LNSIEKKKSNFISLFFFKDASTDEYTAVLLQGSGTYAVEATFSTSVPQHGAKVMDFY
jgi:aspartate aminotransferase-like enzyme